MSPVVSWFERLPFIFMNAVSIPVSEELEVLSPSCIEIVQVFTRWEIYNKHQFSRISCARGPHLDCTVLPFVNKAFQCAYQLRVFQFFDVNKCVCKYVIKGSDMAVFELTGGGNYLNEIYQYPNGAIISSNEVVGRILNFSIHEGHNTVIHLSNTLKMIRESTARQKMLLNVPKRLKKQHSHLSSEMSLYALY
ncbi:hypothetical protein AVEN_41042-1 [Araneus ventricosus]|uniref:Uncharacterized protein n=1 Tax=Araneus ventricosus TaxID=182803 RepID=A0A4Y2CJ73_ARAVE|nr:hypothetical protein AVEN_41042-1 [Araneus ventricosus]